MHTDADPHPSRSDVQTLASSELARAWLTDAAGGGCDPNSVVVEPKVRFDEEARCQPDGMGVNAEGRRVIVEVATGVAAKGGQRNKVTGDLLKLAALRAGGHAERVVVLLTSEELHKKITARRAWRRAAAARLGLEVVLVDPGSDLADRLVRSARHQGAAFRDV